MPSRFFADSDFLIGLADPKDDRAVVSNAIYQDLRKRGHMKGLDGLTLSDHVLVEVFQGVQGGSNIPTAIQFFDRLEHEANIVRTTPALLREAIQTKLAPLANKKAGPKAGGRRIGLVDAATLVVLDRHKIPWLLSFDRGFDEIPFMAHRRIYDLETCSTRVVGPGERRKGK